MKVNEIFYSLQGEGHYTGTPAVFIRFSGCNLRCWFCDTDFQSGTQMTEDEILAEVRRYPASHVVITGGEPTMQLTSSLVNKLHESGYYVMMETNGTRPLPPGCDVDWVTCSPKLINGQLAPVRIRYIDELKVVYEGQDMSLYCFIPAAEHRLQPCDTGDPERNKEILAQTIEYILQHPQWKLSLQTHKILNVR